MKKILYCAAALAMAFFAGSCQQENLEPVVEGGVTYTISLPETVQTKGEEGYNEYDLHYEVYKTADPTALTTATRLFENTVEMLGNETTVTLDLLNNQNYTVLFWANKKGANLNDKYFDLTDLRSVEIKTVAANDDNRDAFCGKDQITNFTGAITRTVELTRPFAQLNIATLVPTAAQIGYDVTPSKSYVKVTSVPTKFNVSTGVANTVAEVEFSTSTEPAACPAGEIKVSGTPYELVAMNYILVPESTIDVYYEITTTNGIVKNTVNNVPVKANYRTNIIGNLLTSNATYTVEIMPGFEGIYDENGQPYVYISSAEELAQVADEIANGNEEYQNIVLGGDIDLSELAITRTEVVSNWVPVGTPEKPFTGIFDGNGYTIKNLNIVETEAKEGKAYIGFFGYAKDATIKNVTFENVNLNIACLDIDHSQGHIGAVAGSLEGTSTIENVTVKGDIKVESTVTANGASRVAVVAGGNSYGNVTMKNVHVIANEGSYLKANNNVGALAGQLQGKNVFENCSSNIDVTGTKFFAGGIIGLAAGDSQFTDCHTTGDVTVTAGREGRHNDEYRVGGIAGGWGDGAKNVCTLTDCSYTGNVSGTNVDGSVANPLDYMGYVGRGYTLNGCQGSTVIIDGVSFVQVGNSAPFGNYEVNGALNAVTVTTVAELNAALVDVDVKNIVLGKGEFGTIVAKSNKTIVGSEYAKVDAVNLNGANNLTLKDIAFDAAGATYGYDGVGTEKVYAFSNIITGDKVNNPNKGAHNLVIDGCTFTGAFANPGAPIAFTDQKRGEGGSGNITIKNCVFENTNANYTIYGHYTGDSTNGHGNFVIENNTFKSACYAGPIYLGRYASNVPVVVKENTFETVTSIGDAIYVQDHSNYGVSINASGNTFAE